MDTAAKYGSEAISNVITFLQTIRIVELRQALEVVGVHHVEVVAAILLFVLLQFTKFTGVLLLACLLAYGIFYMWETWFPELRESLSGNSNYGNTGYGAGYGPVYGPDAVPRNDFISYTYQNTYTYRDARTSALFPPFANNESYDVLRGDSSTNHDEKQASLHDVRKDGLRFNQRHSLSSGAVTPIGHHGSSMNMRPLRRPYGNQLDDFKHARRPADRDNQLFRKMIANEYRLNRPGTSTEYHRNTSLADEQRSRRIPGIPDEFRQQKNRRNPDIKSAPPRKFNGNEHIDRLRNESREHMLRKARNIPGTSNRPVGTYNRYDPTAPHNNSDNRGTKRRTAFSISSSLTIGAYNMDKVELMEPSHEDSETLILETNCERDCDEDGTSCNCKSEIELPAIKSNGSYPYVIEMVYDSSSEHILTEQSDQSVSKAIKRGEENIPEESNTATKMTKSDIESSSSQKYPHIVEIPSKSK